MVNNIFRRNAKNIKDYKNKINRVDKLIKDVSKVISERFKLIEELQRREKRIRREFDRAVSQKNKKNHLLLIVIQFLLGVIVKM